MTVEVCRDLKQWLQKLIGRIDIFLGSPVPCVCHLVPPTASKQVWNRFGIGGIIQDDVPMYHDVPTSHAWFARRSSQCLLLLAEMLCFQEIACSHKVGQGHCPKWKLCDSYASCSLGWLNSYLSTTCSSWILSVKSGVCGKSWRWLKPKFKRTRTLTGSILWYFVHKTN